MTTCTRAILCAVVLAAPPALAEGQPWSVVGARTVEPGANAVELTAGLPVVSAAYLRGIAPGLQLGVRASFTYAVEGLLGRFTPGFKAQALGKFRFFDTGVVSGAVTFEPGFIYAPAPYPSTVIALGLPVGLVLGLTPVAALGLALTFEVPLWVQFGYPGGLNVPLMTGIGAEYAISSALLLYARVRSGPTLRLATRRTEFTFEAVVGVGVTF